MPTPRPFSTFLSAIVFTALSVPAFTCSAQTPAVKPVAKPAAAATVVAAVPGTPLSPQLSRRVEVLLRQKASLPPGATVNIGPRTPSDLAGYDSISATVTTDGHTSHPIRFLLSKDNKTLAQFTKFDISGDPRDLVSATGRPARGGPATAPVLFVNFDDLECPFCAQLNATLFPAITQRYGDKVRIVFRDFPLDQHPWAMHAAVDVECLAAQSPTGYWNLVDLIHARSSDIGTSPDPKVGRTLPLAVEQLDKLTREQGKLQKVNETELDACIAKQDTKAIEASVALGTSLGVESTPTMFINGAKIDGALPLSYIFGVIDEALRAENVTPPPPYVEPSPAPAARAAAAAPPTPAAPPK